MSKINGKAIYSPKGKAGEYAKYAVNFYVGCSNDCTYCYCKRGILGHAMGAPVAALKKCFKDETHARQTFEAELYKHLDEIRPHGLFFTFTSDPMLADTRSLTIQAVEIALSYGVPCQILTKRADFIDELPDWWSQDAYRDKLAFGFTLTGHDELEPGASSNAERIEAMKRLHAMGFKTFASIEPVIDIESSSKMIVQTLGHCDFYKIGLLSGKREYSKADVTKFVLSTSYVVSRFILVHRPSVHPRLYFKDSAMEYIGYTRKELRESALAFRDLIVEADYNLFAKKEEPKPKQTIKPLKSDKK